METNDFPIWMISVASGFLQYHTIDYLVKRQFTSLAVKKDMTSVSNRTFTLAFYLILASIATILARANLGDRCFMLENILNSTMPKMLGPYYKVVVKIQKVIQNIGVAIEKVPTIGFIDIKLLAHTEKDTLKKILEYY